MSLLIVNTIQPQTGSIVNISGSLQISQSLIVADDITLSGKLTLGNANTDNIVVNSEFTSSLIPDIDGAFDLGTGIKKWGTIFAKSGSFDNISGSVNLTDGLVTITSASISYLSGSSPITVGGEMIPDVTNTHNLGSAVKKFNDLFINDISASGDVTSSGTGSFTGGIDAMDATGSFGYISASGDISTSGTVYGITGSFELIEGTITTVAQPNIISLGTIFNLSATNITSSGNITASSFQTNNITIGSSNISGVGQISASRVSASVGFEADTTSTSSFGHISASGDISTSANILAAGNITGITGSFSHLVGNSPIIVGSSMTFLSGSADILANGHISASTLQVANNAQFGQSTVYINSALGQISASRVSASAGFEADTASTSSFGHISSSGMIYSETNISASGIINSEGDISSSANIGAIGNAYNGFMPGTGSFGNVTASHTIHVGSAVPLGHGITLTHTGQISASRVSASAGFEADTLSTSSFGYISASGNISSSGTGMNYFGGNIQIGLNTAFVGTLQAVGNVNAEHLYSSDDAVIDDNLQVGGGINVLGNGGNVGHISASGNVSASGFDTRITPAASADAFSYSVNGRKVEVRNQLQAQLDDGTFTHIELRNTSIATDSIVLGSFTGNTITNITGSIITAATTALYTASIQIHNETAENITNDTSYTASFIIL